MNTVFRLLKYTPKEPIGFWNAEITSDLYESKELATKEKIKLETALKKINPHCRVTFEINRVTFGNDVFYKKYMDYEI